MMGANQISPSKKRRSELKISPAEKVIAKQQLRDLSLSKDFQVCANNSDKFYSSIAF